MDFISGLESYKIQRNTEYRIPGQFMKQGTFMGLNLICRNRSFIRGIQHIATTLCQKLPHMGDTDSLTDADRSSDTKIKPFFFGFKNIFLGGDDGGQ